MFSVPVQFGASKKLRTTGITESFVLVSQTIKKNFKFRSKFTNSQHFRTPINFFGNFCQQRRNCSLCLESLKHQKSEELLQKVSHATKKF
jgi:hypothetical protein